MNQVDVLNIWASDSRAKARAGALRTEDGKLFSYNLCIGVISPSNMLEGEEAGRLRFVFDYGREVSGSTSRHVNLAKQLAHLIYPVRLDGNIDWKNPRLGHFLLTRTWPRAFIVKGSQHDSTTKG